MFNFFAPKTIAYTQQDTYKMSNEPEVKDYFRVGVTESGNTTLTVIGKDGMSMTLSMTPYICEKMIRMLRATYDDEEDSLV